MTDKTQALLPCPKCESENVSFSGYGRGVYCIICKDCCIQTKFYQAKADVIADWNTRRISHSLPRDVGTDADAQRNIVRAVIDCYNIARPAGLSPVEYVHSKRLVRDAFASLSSVPGQIEQDELLDLIDDAISDSFDEEWNSRMGARHIAGALEHEGWAVVPLAALTPSPCPGDGMREALDELPDLKPVQLCGLSWKQALKALGAVDCALRRPHWCSPVVILKDGMPVIDDDGDIKPFDFMPGDRTAMDWAMVPRVGDDGKDVPLIYRASLPTPSALSGEMSGDV